jgi:hypothetical protein
MASTIQACAGLVLSMFGGLGGGVVGATSYVAESAEIDEASRRYGEWEVDLMLEALNAASSHSGYDEYRFNLDPIGHDPFALIAYLTARHNDFTFAAVQSELQGIFNQQYTLTFTPSMEIRFREEERTGTGSGVDADGNPYSYTYTYTVIVEYEWHIMTVTLINRGLESVIVPRLTTQEQQERYAVLMMTKGFRQYVGNPLGLNPWLSLVTRHYGYYINSAGTKVFNPGVDIALPVNTPVLAGGAGTVLATGNNATYGRFILVDYGNGITARYGQLSNTYFTTGQPVQAGWILGISGTTLYVEVLKDGRYISPFFFLDGAVDF